MMIGRIGVERLEVVRIFHGAELRHVERAVRIELDAHHVVDADGGDDGMRELGMLRDHRAHQKAAVRTAHQRELVVRGITTLDEIAPGRCEIVEDVLLLREHAFLMPALAIFGAAADVGDHIDAAGVQPDAP
jgi:hypothetical protein